MYEKGDVVWVKNPHGKCTTEYGTGRITEVISPQSVKIDGVPRHVKDLGPVIQTQLSSSDESDSEDSERLIYLNSDPLDYDSDASSLPTDEASVEPRTADESTHEDEACVIPLRRSTRQRRKLPHLPVCDHEIRGECGENHDLPDLRVAAFCTFQSLKRKNKKAKMATHSRFCTRLVSHKVTQTRVSHANEIVGFYKKSTRRNGDSLNRRRVACVCNLFKSFKLQKLNAKTFSSIGQFSMIDKISVSQRCFCHYFNI